MSKAAELAKIGEVATNSQIGGRRNIVINGAMQVAQRSTEVAALGATSGYYTLDRNRLTFSGTAGRLTMTQTADGPSGFANCLKLDCTTADTSVAAGEILILGQNFEGQDLQQFKKGTSDAEKITVSFYIKGNANATYTCELYDNDNSRSIAQEFSVTSSWSRVVLTFNNETSNAFDDDTASSLLLHLWLHGGATFAGGTFASNTWHTTNANRLSDSQSSFFDSDARTFFLTGVQMEVGSVATPFEHRSSGEELELCKRYYHKLLATGPYQKFAVGTAFTTDDCMFVFKLSPEMRGIPTLDHGTLSKLVVTDTDLSAEAIGSLAIDTNTDGPQGVSVKAADIAGDVMTAGDATILNANNDVAAYLAFDAEIPE